MSLKHSREWTKKTYVKYGDLIFDILTAPPAIYKNTPEQVELIDKTLKRYYPKAKRILDVPCGDGRISLGLLKKDYEVTGIDISPGYIKKANLKAKGNKKARFVVKDMREIDFKNEFNAVINWFGSFGYFDDQTNEEVLERFINSLTPKGLLILDLTNRDYVIQRMGSFYEWQPEVVFRKKKGKLFARYEFDPFTNRVEATIQIGDTQDKIYYKMRYYSLNELVSIVVKHSMRVVDVYGDYQGNKFSLFSPRVIMIACK